MIHEREPVAMAETSDPPPAPEPAAPPGPVLELVLAPEDAARLANLPELRGRTGARRRPAAQRCVWHDTPDGRLAGAGLALAECHGPDTDTWRLERMVPEADEIAPPGLPARLLAEAADLEALLPDLKPPDLKLPDAEALRSLVPFAAFEGQERVLGQTPGGTTITLHQGTLRAVAATAPVCRLVLAGTGAPALARALATQLRAAVPHRSLAAEAFALARRAAPARHLGAPGLRPGLDVDTGFAFLVAHLTGVILHHAATADGAHGPEPVHQMRVGLRRLRSALLLFRRAAACPALDDAGAHLKRLGRVLGPPRDWDVFCAGTGRAVHHAFPDDPHVAQLLAAAERRRQAGYAELARYLASPDFRELGIVLATLCLQRPWRDHLPDDTEAAEKRSAMQTSDIADYAARALSRRLGVTIAPGPDIAGLPFDSLHDIRLHCKRLRYAAEFFSPLYPGREARRFLRRLAVVQERLGHLNDGAVASALMAQLPGRGAGRAEAVGIVRGFVAATSGGGRRKIERAWHRFLRLEPFWA